MIYTLKCINIYLGYTDKPDLKPPKPRVHFAEESSSPEKSQTPTKNNNNSPAVRKHHPLPRIKEIMVKDDEFVDTANAVSPKEIQQSASKIVTSPEPGVTRVVRTFYASATPRKNDNTANLDLAERYAASGINMLEHKRKVFILV